MATVTGDEGEWGQFLPAHLTAAQQRPFLDALKDFPSLKNYFCSLEDPDPLQGDCWEGVPILRFEDGVRDTVRAILISNSCDASPGNQRFIPPKLTFAPLVTMEKYAGLLHQRFESERVHSHLDQVRAQKVSTLFYMPNVPGIGDAIAILTDMFSVPLKAVTETPSIKKSRSLGDVAFYLFLFKLSYHFCRFQEGIDRSEVVQA